jgi:hypothetical protein
MKVNAAHWDRALRAIAGVVLFAVAIYSNLGSIISIILGILGAIMLIVAITGTCPVYSLIGVSTLKEKKK